MWFASIWIFSLRLPWPLGAEFFLRHLIDGDPASNTLSWRWVAGLHTRGKHYVARADNIRRYTEGRFDPAGLDEYPDSLEEERPPREQKLTPRRPSADGEVALLLHLDDLHPESLPLDGATVRRVGGLIAHAPDAAAQVLAADEAAMEDGLRRAAAHFGCEIQKFGPDWDRRAARRRPGRRSAPRPRRCRRIACGCAGTGTRRRGRSRPAASSSCARRFRGSWSSGKSSQPTSTTACLTWAGCPISPAMKCATSARAMRPLRQDFGSASTL